MQTQHTDRNGTAARILIGLAAALALGVLATAALAGDWTNSGGNAGRNGLAADIGPDAAELAWSGGRSSLIAWHPVTEAGRAFMVRQPRWPEQQPDDAFIVAMDLATGAELWAVVLPYETGDWIPWIAGVMDGKVYASRAGNGATISAPVYALDVADGSTVWVSTDEVDAGAYDGVVFAPNGDLLVASFRDIWRIDATDGTTVWHAARTGSVSGNCGGARHGDAFYVADATAGGNIIVRYDVATGMRMYESPLMPGFLIQNTPFVDPAGTVYLNRAQNNPSVDFYYAFTDTGAGFVEKWHVAGMGGASAEFGVGPDGSVYVVTAGPRLARLDPETGTTLDETAVFSAFSKARIAVDAAGKVYFSNGDFAGGRLYAYDADLTPRWDVAVTNINIGGPSLGQNGTLVVCGIGTDVRAYRTATAAIADPGSGAQAAAVAVVTLRSAPSPFRETTDIRYVLPRPGMVTLEVFDVRGMRVRTLVDGATRAAGEHAVRWGGRSDGGERLPSGIYFYRLTAGALAASGRTMIVR